MEQTYKFGKLPAVEGAIKFQFVQYFSQPDLPKPPKIFGVWQHFWNIKMFQNDRIGNCVMAGAANETASYYHDIGKWVEFVDEGVISDYKTLSGYDPVKKFDPGLEMAKAAEYRRTIGIIDRYGRRHKVDAYVALPKRDFDTLKTAMYQLFGRQAVNDHEVADLLPALNFRNAFYQSLIENTLLQVFFDQLRFSPCLKRNNLVGFGHASSPLGLF